MNSSKKGAQHLTAILKQHKIRNVILCPGSRNAPLIISFTSDPYFNCLSMVDERSAAFYALGMAQHEEGPVAIVCTSGSALLNIGPAVVEAFYQRLPLVVISADRPLEWVNQGESQTMNQKAVFKNYIRADVDLPQEPRRDEELRVHDEAIHACLEKSMRPYFGPVHINIRFEEPLYGQMDVDVTPFPGSQSFGEIEHKPLPWSDLKKSWNEHQHILILCGQMLKDTSLKNTLRDLAEKGIVVVSESISNQEDERFIPYIDKIIIPASEEEKEELKPDLLITLGGPLISRKIKHFLRAYQDIEHWHVDALDPSIDAYGYLKHGIAMKAQDFLSEFITEAPKKSDFHRKWFKALDHVEKKSREYILHAPFSDLKAFSFLLNHIPPKAHLHVGNSSSIRYAQLFREGRGQKCHSNRGISGIEGCVSTAAGYSLNFKDKTLVITGDLSMIYDSNALWNNYLSAKFKIVVVNNGGGGIFKIIEGPKSVDRFEEFIETKHQKNLRKLADFHDVKFFSCGNEEELVELWEPFIHEDKQPAMLEIRTMNINNEEVLKSFFEHLKK